jgi:hypothetical protein
MTAGKSGLLYLFLAISAFLNEQQYGMRLFLLMKIYVSFRASSAKAQRRAVSLAVQKEN